MSRLIAALPVTKPNGANRMAYRILRAEQGCNTSRMVRVVNGHELVAMFLSGDDAAEYIKRKETRKKTKAPYSGL